jgi:hypothetical protein
MPRLLSRTLFVLGGAVATTAAAWLISSASASADTMPGTPAAGPLTGTVSDTASGAHGGPVSGSLTSVGVPAGSGEVPALPHPALPSPSTLPSSSTLPHPPALPGAPALPSALTLPANHDPADGVSGVTGELRSAVSQIGTHMPVDRGVSVAPLPAWPSTPAPVSTSTGRSGQVGGPADAGSRPVVPAVVAPLIEAGPAAAVRHVVDRSTARPVHPAGPVAPSAPAAPNPTPWSPVTMPAAPGGGGFGGATGSGGDGMIDQSGAPHVPGLDVIRVVPVTASLGRVTAGKQPGITPD